jgi:hypothetical protein
MVAMRPIPFLKLKLAETLLGHVSPILCASIGRVASTAVQRALEQEKSNAVFGFSNNFGRALVREKAWNLKGVRFRPGAVYKTHDFPYHLAAAPRLKIIFLYGRPSDSILSVVRCHATHGPAWIERHFANMHANGDYRELLQRDVLRIGEQLAAWRAVRNLDVLGMRYAALWDNVDILSNFVGFRVPLPSRIERNFLDLNPAIVAIARENYRALDRKEARLPDYFYSLQSESTESKGPETHPMTMSRNLHGDSMRKPEAGCQD